MPNCTATCAPSREELPLQVTCTLRLRRAASLLPVVSGADGETRTPTGFPTTPSRWRVYQFHHVGASLRADQNPEHYQHRGLCPSPSVHSFYFGISFAFESPPGAFESPPEDCGAAVPGAGI